MSLVDASQMGTMNDVNSLFEIFTSIMSAALPFLGFCLIFYTGYRIKKRQEHKNKLKEQQKQIQQQIQQAQKINLTRQQQIVNLTRQNRIPVTTIPTNNLAIDFDKNGKIIRKGR